MRVARVRSQLRISRTQTWLVLVLDGQPWVDQRHSGLITVNFGMLLLHAGYWPQGRVESLTRVGCCVDHGPLRVGRAREDHRRTRGHRPSEPDRFLEAWLGQTYGVIPGSGSPLRRGDPSLRFRSPRERALWILCLAAVPAAMWAVAQVLGWPVPVRAVLAGLAALAVVAIPEVRARRAREDKATQYLSRLRVPVVNRRLPLVKDANFGDLGVHEAILQVEYVPRDAERELNIALVSRQAVLLVGHSMAGKTRLAAERVKAIYPLAPLLTPSTAAGLRALVDDGLILAGTVVWLDDFERFLKGDNGIDVSLLGQLQAGGAIVVATIRRNELNAFRPTKDDSPPQWDVIQCCTQVHLARRLTQTEQDLVRARIIDEATLDAIDRYGLTEYLGGGPEAIDRFDDGEISHPVGYALVRAAVDWRRAGLVRLISLDNLRSGMLFYLEDRPDVSTSPAAFDDGIRWATEHINETVGLLGAHERRAQQTDGPLVPLYEAFDYIVDVLVNRNLASEDKEFPIPVGMWDMVKSVASPAEKPDVTRAANRYFVPRPAVMEAVTRWLNDNRLNASHGLLITGAAGSGKSVVMFQLREELPRRLHDVDLIPRFDMIPPQIGPPQAFINRAFSLYGRSVGEFKDDLAMQLGVPPVRYDPTLTSEENDRNLVQVFRSVLKDRSRRQIVLLDALDEAPDPTGLWDFLQLLVSSSNDLPISVIIASRRIIYLYEHGLADWTVIDLESEPFKVTDAAVGFIVQRLLEAPGSAYAGRLGIAEEAAMQISQRSDGSMLMMGLLVDRALELGIPASGAELDSIIPRSFIDLVRELLASLGPDRTIGVGVMRVLASAGRGLTTQELMESVSASGARLNDAAHMARIVSQLSRLLFVTNSPETGEATVNIRHERIRQVFLDRTI